MPEKVRLHLDSGVSRRSLYQALLDRGHDVTRTPNPWMPSDASDEDQLLGATAQNRAIFTFNTRDFIRLAQVYPGHRGILFAAQQSWNLRQLIAALDRFLAESEAEEIVGQIIGLNRVRS